MRIDESKEREREKKKYLPFFPGVEKNPSREKVSVQESSPGRKKREGKERKKRVKPQGSEVTQYFIHRASPE